MDDAVRHAATLSLVDVAARIDLSDLHHDRPRGPIVPAADAERLAREVSGHVTLNIVEDGNHIANNRPYRWRTQCADWMADELRAS